MGMNYRECFCLYLSNSTNFVIYRFYSLLFCEFGSMCNTEFASARKLTAPE